MFVLAKETADKDDKKSGERRRDPDTEERSMIINDEEDEPDDSNVVANVEDGYEECDTDKLNMENRSNAASTSELGQLESDKNTDSKGNPETKDDTDTGNGSPAVITDLTDSKTGKSEENS